MSLTEATPVRAMPTLVSHLGASLRLALASDSSELSWTLFEIHIPCHPSCLFFGSSLGGSLSLRLGSRLGSTAGLDLGLLQGGLLGSRLLLLRGGLLGGSLPLLLACLDNVVCEGFGIRCDVIVI